MRTMHRRHVSLVLHMCSCGAVVALRMGKRKREAESEGSLASTSKKGKKDVDPCGKFISLAGTEDSLLAGTFEPPSLLQVPPLLLVFLTHSLLLSLSLSIYPFLSPLFYRLSLSIQFSLHPFSSDLLPHYRGA